MGAVRIVVADVDAEIAAPSRGLHRDRALGTTLRDPVGRRPRPLGVRAGNVGGPGERPAHRSDAAQAAVRLVLEVEELEPSVDALLAAGWESATEPVSGRGDAAARTSRRGVPRDLRAALSPESSFAGSV